MVARTARDAAAEVHRRRRERHRGLCPAANRRDRRADHEEEPPARLDRCDSPLDVFHGAPGESTAVVPDRGVDVRCRVCAGGTRSGSHLHAVPQDTTVPARGRHPLFRSDALALRHRRRLRRLHADVGVQRADLDGAVRWTNARGLEVRRDVFTGGPLDLSRFPAMDAGTWTRLLASRGIKEVEFTRIQDGPYYVVQQAPETEAVPKQRERLHQPYYVTGRAEADRVLVAPTRSPYETNPSAPNRS